MHIPDPDLTILTDAIGFKNTGLTIPNTFDLRSRQLDARNKGIQQVVFESRSFIPYV
jgi:hypothetical protein